MKGLAAMSPRLPPSAAGQQGVEARNRSSSFWCCSDTSFEPALQRYTLAASQLASQPSSQPTAVAATLKGTLSTMIAFWLKCSFRIVLLSRSNVKQCSSMPFCALKHGIPPPNQGDLQICLSRLCKPMLCIHYKSLPRRQHLERWSKPVLACASCPGLCQLLSRRRARL